MIAAKIKRMNKAIRVIVIRVIGILASKIIIMIVTVKGAVIVKVVIVIVRTVLAIILWNKIVTKSMLVIAIVTVTI